ncbi:MAG TPA: molybdenum cofactor guanylyltransferase MobA, partial [Paracoccaceae bacterium]|nr:molybdenum cofactor guanylyltransferase MobA [Paracoccaceae bacterium]
PHPVFALWPVGCREALRAALAAGRHKVIAFLEAQGAARAVFESHPFDPFFNVNTPDDKAEAERLAAEFGL